MKSCVWCFEGIMTMIRTMLYFWIHIGAWCSCFDWWFSPFFSLFTCFCVFWLNFFFIFSHFVEYLPCHGHLVPHRFMGGGAKSARTKFKGFKLLFDLEILCIWIDFIWEKKFDINLKKSVKFWDLKILWIWDFAQLDLRKFEIHGSSEWGWGKKISIQFCQLFFL